MKVFPRAVRLEMLSGLCMGIVLAYILGHIALFIALGLFVGILSLWAVPKLREKIYYVTALEIVILAVVCCLKWGGII